MKAIEFMTNYPVLFVSLPREVYLEKSKEYAYASREQKGIMAEMLLTLGLKRIFKEKASWIFDKFSVADFRIDEHLIDVKSTTQKFYQGPNPERALDYIKHTKQDLSFVLAAPEEWNEEDFTIKMRMHEICTYHPDGTFNLVRLKGSYKSFKK